MKMGPIYLLLVFCLYPLVLATEPLAINKEHSNIVDPTKVERLRQMFKGSYDLALEGMYEAKVLNALKGVPSASLAQIAQDHDDAIINQTPQVSHSNVGLKSDARQSSLFSSFRPPVLSGLGSSTNPVLGSSPFMSNLLSRPSELPKFPAFSLIGATPKPPKPAKSSIIGNNGGTTALTNDNVVVVNVLSNNY